MRALISIIVGIALLAPAGAAQAQSESDLKRELAAHMGAAGASSGAFVVNTSTSRRVFAWNPGKPRILASNTKLFTTATALARFGTDGTLGTEVLGTGTLRTGGVWRGNLYLRGGGDPSFSSRSFGRRAYGGRVATVEALAKRIDMAGFTRITGRIVGDESNFDSRRGGPESGFGVSPYVGPLSAMALNRGLADERGFSYQSDPPAYAAARLAAALERRGIDVTRKAISGRTPGGADVVASVSSPPMARLVALTNKPSDNFFAEMLIKAIGWQATGLGTTASGARRVAGFARRLGAKARIRDGSGLSRGNRAAPRRVVRLLRAIQARDEFDAFSGSLAIAGRDGTLSDRMRSGPARGHCRGKTGTLSNVSALSGYCRARSGDVYAFSILMNNVSPTGARSLQDRMAQAIAAVRG